MAAGVVVGILPFLPILLRSSRMCSGPRFRASSAVFLGTGSSKGGLELRRTVLPHQNQRAYASNQRRVRPRHTLHAWREQVSGWLRVRRPFSRIQAGHDAGAIGAAPVLVQPLKRCR